MRPETKERWLRRRYLVPNAVTLCNLFCGFLTIIYAASFRYEKAALAIGIAIVLDGLDGRVARRLKATSKFGVEFDSFSDLVSFGVAPALLIYHWCFQKQADEFGVVITFIYVVCAATRLARFNISPPDTKKFVGLPSPGAAAVVAALTNCLNRWASDEALLVVGTISMLSLSYLMVSRIDFLSVKELKITGIRRFARVFIACLIALIWYNNRIGFVVLTVGYAVSGPLTFLLRRRKDSASGPLTSSDQQPHTLP